MNLVLKKGGDGRLFFELSEEELAANAAARAEEATEATISQAVERGEQFLKKRQYEKALKSFTNALQVDKNRVEIWVGLAILISKCNSMAKRSRPIRARLT